MTWNLGLPDVYPLMFPGQDDAIKEYMFLGLIEKYKDYPNKCLQVGVLSPRTTKFGPSFTSIDLYDKRPCIDLNQDIEKTTFIKNTFDFIVCNAILEHVKNPFKAAAEISRICKPNGYVWAEVPFVQPYHPTKKKWEPSDGLLVDGFNTDGKDDFNHGGDYWRFTPQGICQLMLPFVHIGIYLCSDGGIAYYGRNNKGE